MTSAVRYWSLDRHCIAHLLAPGLACEPILALRSDVGELNSKSGTSVMRKSDRTKACQPMFDTVDSPLLRLTEIGERLVARDEWSLWLVDLPIDKEYVPHQLQNGSAREVVINDESETYILESLLISFRLIFCSSQVKLQEMQSISISLTGL